MSSQGENSVSSSQEGLLWGWCVVRGPLAQAFRGPSFCWVGSVVVEFGVFGAPRFSVQRPQNTCFKGLWEVWTESRGAQKTPNSTTTDPTPHSRPSEVGFGQRGPLERGSFQKSPFSTYSREFRDSREPPDCGKQGRIGPFFRDSREFRDFRDSRDSSSQKTPFVMTPFSGPDEGLG